MMPLTGDPLWSFENVRSINAKNRFTHFDYVRLLRQSGKIDQQALIKWLSEYTPPITENDGKIYLAEQFPIEKSDCDHPQNQSDLDIQIFANLINVSDIIGLDSQEHLIHIAKKIAKNLNEKISKKYPAYSDRASIFFDDGDCYISVTRR